MSCLKSLKQLVLFFVVLECRGLILNEALGAPAEKVDVKALEEKIKLLDEDGLTKECVPELIKLSNHAREDSGENSLQHLEAQLRVARMASQAWINDVADEYFKKSVEGLTWTEGYTERVVNLWAERANFYSSHRMAEKALEPASTAVEQARKIFGEDSPIYANALKSFAGAVEKSDPAKAKELRDKANWIVERDLLTNLAEARSNDDLDHENVASSLLKLAYYYKKNRRWSDSKKCFNDAEEILIKKYGPSHPKVAEVIKDYVELFASSRDLKEEERQLSRCLETYRLTYGENSLELEKIYQRFAMYYMLNDIDYAKSVELAQKAREIAKNKPMDRRLLNDLFDLGRCYYFNKQYNESMAVFKAVLAERTNRHYERFVPRTCYVYHWIAWINTKTGNLKEAEEISLENLKVQEQAYGREDIRVITSLYRLGDFYEEVVADYSKALPVYLRRLDLIMKCYPTNLSMQGWANIDVGHCYSHLGDLDRALEYGQKGLDLVSKEGETVSVGDVYWWLGHFTESQSEKAEAYYKKALDIYQKKLGKDSKATATCTKRLAHIYTKRGEYKKAEELLQYALKVSNPNSDLSSLYLEWAISLHKQGRFIEAEDLLEKALKRHKDESAFFDVVNLNLYDALVYVKYDLGKMDESMAYALKARNARMERLKSVFSFTSEEQRLNYLKSSKEYYSIFPTMDNAEEALTSTLSIKGKIIDSIIADRDQAELTNDPEVRTIVAELQQAKRQFANFVFEGTHLHQEHAPTEKKLSAANTGQSEISIIPEVTTTSEAKKLYDRILSLERSLGSIREKVNPSSTEVLVDYRKVQPELPENSALLEFAVYEHYLGSANFEKRYGVSLLTKDGTPKWICLGPTKEIDQAIKLYSLAVKGEFEEGAFRSAMQAVYQKIWKPIEKILPDEVDHLIVSPDGRLNFVSFASLFNAKDEFLCEKYVFRYVSTGRDVLKKLPPVDVSSITIFADPQFDAGFGEVADASTAVKNDSATSRSISVKDLLAGIGLTTLPGTVRECNTIKKVADRLGWKSSIYRGADATEEQLLKLNSPGILHLATHAFFIDHHAKVDDPFLEKIIQDPMNRSGLCLAGAKKTLAAWKRGDRPPLQNDGIVTAHELSSLNLEQTWLVVLSACDTGYGQVKSGEGVIGLRRGFRQAGARNLLMSLWPVDDEVTSAMMAEFYENLHAPCDVNQFWSNIQKKWLVDYRKTKGISSAVRYAGPFILSE